LDNFAVRPVVIVLLGASFSRSQAIMQFLEQEQSNVRLIELYEQSNGK
jgi:hypothetical protein